MCEVYFGGRRLLTGGSWYDRVSSSSSSSRVR